jgi:peptidoglycan/LPS O-acetylase OafA/YrhL
LCIYSLVFSIENQLVGFLGRISYPIYLFHMSYYILLSKYGWFPKNSIQQFIMFLLLFPFFVFFCSHLDRFGGYLYRKLRFLPLFTAAQPGAAVDR